LCHPASIGFQNIHPPERSPHPYQQSLSCSLTQPLAATNLLSVSGFACSGHFLLMGYRTVGPFLSVSATQCHVLKTDLHCSVCQCSFPFHGWVIFHCVDRQTTFCSSTRWSYQLFVLCLADYVVRFIPGPRLLPAPCRPTSVSWCPPPWGGPCGDDSLLTLRVAAAESSEQDQERGGLVNT
jgi:hypothetical protein